MTILFSKWPDTASQEGMKGGVDVHLVVEDLGLSRGGVGNEGLVEDVEDILANLLKLAFDLVAVLLDGADVLLGTLGLLLLLDGGDDTPAGAAGSDNVLVGDREQVALVDGELTAELGNLLHVGHHLIVAFSLLAEPGEESLAIALVCHLEGRGGKRCTGMGVDGRLGRRGEQRDQKRARLETVMQVAEVWFGTVL